MDDNNNNTILADDEFISTTTPPKGVKNMPETDVKSTAATGESQFHKIFTNIVTLSN